MSLSRRKFVYLTSLSVAAVSAGAPLFAQNGAQGATETFTDEGSATLANLQLKDFQWLIGERFSISSATQKLGKLTLIAATELDPIKPSNVAHVGGSGAVPLASPPLSGFLLRFQGAGGTLPQDTYIMKQGSLGTFPLFLVPEGPGISNQASTGSNHPTYIAVFTRFADSAANKLITPAQ
jgi:hypothetical protein